MNCPSNIRWIGFLISVGCIIMLVIGDIMTPTCMHYHNDICKTVGAVILISSVIGINLGCWISLCSCNNDNIDESSV